MGILVGCKFHFLQVHIINFLTQKRLDPRVSFREVNEVDFYKFDPFELPGLSESQSDDQVWNFFSEPSYRNASGKQPHRVRGTGAGYWKSTGRGCDVRDRNCNFLGSKRTLVFYESKRGRPSKETKTDWVMHEFYIEDSPRYKVQSQELASHPLNSDTENHFTENTFTEVAPQPEPQGNEQKGCLLEQQIELVSSQNLVSDSGNHVKENIFPMVESQQTSSQNLASDSSYHGAEKNFSMVRVCHTVKSQVLQGQNLASDPANHVPGNVVSTVELDQPLSSYDMVFDLGNHKAENTSLMVEPQAVSPCNLGSQLGNHVIENDFPRVAPQLPLNPNMVFDSTNHVAENTFCRVVKSIPYGSFEHQPMVDLQLPSRQYSVSGSTNHDAENTCSVVEKNMPMVESSSPADFGAFNGPNGLNHGSFSAPQMPINPEQGSYSSSNNSGNDCNVWSSQFDGEHEDVANPQQDFQDEYPHEETEQPLPAGIDDEAINMMISELLEAISPVDCVNHN